MIHALQANQKIKFSDHLPTSAFIRRQQVTFIGRSSDVD